MKLFLAEFTLSTFHYPDGPRETEKMIRIVQASCHSAAVRKVREAFEGSSPGGDSTRIEYLELNEAL